MPHISLSAETLWKIGPLPITNSLLATWSVMLLLFLISFFATRNLSLIPSTFQSIIEVVIESLYSFFESIAGHHTKKIFPLVASLFLFIILANWEGLLPGVGTIGFFRTAEKKVVSMETEQERTAESLREAETEVLEEEHIAVEALEEHEGIESAEEAMHDEEVVAEEAAEASHGETAFVPILRGATADLNMTLALAVFSVLAIQYFGFTTLGFHYSKRFFNFANPIMFFIGILEIISEISKVISFSFRLFGNIFAGEVLLSVMAFLMPFIAPLPFIGLELFVGFIQAIVFSTLTAVFVNVAIEHEG